MQSENELTILRKRLIMRAEHRGIKEMDIILGKFVREHVESFDKTDIIELESMMDVNDQLLYAMISGHLELDPEHSKWLQKIVDFAQNSVAVKK